MVRHPPPVNWCPYRCVIVITIVGKGDDSRFGEITIKCLQAAKKLTSKNIFARIQKIAKLRENLYPSHLSILQ